MTLRGKLLLAQAPAALALLLVGVAAVGAITSLGSGPALILKDNYRSVLASERMLWAEKQLDDLAVARAAGQAVPERAEPDAAAVFETELRAQEANITERGERDATRRLRQRWTAYQAARDAVLATPSIARYFAVLAPAGAALQSAAREILEINQDAMQRKSESARRAAERTVALLVTGTAAAVLAGAILSGLLTRRLLRPLGVLTHTARRIGEGDLDVRAPADGGDEIAALGAEFNTMAEHLRQYRSSSLGELLQAQQASQAAIDSLPDPVLVLQASGTIENLNGAAERLFARAGGAAPALDGLDPTLRATVDRVRAYVLAGRGTYVPSGFDEAVKLDGAEGPRHLLPRASPLYSETGSIAGVTVVLQDVTRLMRFDELKNDLVATVAHEFRTPLTSLRMAVHLLAEEMVGPLAEKQADLVHAAREDCDRLQGIVDDLLDLSRIQSGRLELAWGSAVPGALLDAVVAEHRAEAADRGVTVALRAGEHLPEVEVDEDRIRLVLANLLSNALRYSPRGGTITLSAVAGDGCVRFEVADEGPGIPPALHERIFEKFYRMPGAPPGGVGLGLYLAREIVQAHGGRIGVESAPGAGSRFWFTVPQRAARAAAS